MKPKPTVILKRRRPGERHQDWASRLFSFIEANRHLPFAWGSRDCCIFACDGIRATTGLDPAAKMFRGKYHDATGAARLLKKHGGVEAVAERVCRDLGFEETPVSLAQRGDVVLLDLDDAGQPAARAEKGSSAIGLCLGGQAAFPGATGLQFVPLAKCRRAWAVARPLAEKARVG